MAEAAGALLLVLWALLSTFVLPAIVGVPIIPRPDTDDSASEARSNVLPHPPTSMLLGILLSAVLMSVPTFVLLRTGRCELVLLPVSVFGGALLIHFCAVLLGADLFVDAFGTLCMSVYIACLSLVAPYARFGSDATRWRRAFLLQQHPLPEDAAAAPYDALAVYGAYGSVFGAWLSSVVLPLHLDASWQTYPAPAVIGACIGFAIGALVALIVQHSPLRFVLLRSRKER